VCQVDPTAGLAPRPRWISQTDRVIDVPDHLDRSRYVRMLWNTPADRVICVGAAHAWGGTAAALSELAGVVPPGGRLLYGDGCWEREPTDAASALYR
jgi:hypothetical protein